MGSARAAVSTGGRKDRQTGSQGLARGLGPQKGPAGARPLGRPVHATVTLPACDGATLRRGDHHTLRDHTGSEKACRKIRMEIRNPDRLVWSASLQDHGLLGFGSNGAPSQASARCLSARPSSPPRPLGQPCSFPKAQLRFHFLDFPSLLGSPRSKAPSPLLPTCAATVQSPWSRERTSP